MVEIVVLVEGRLDVEVGTLEGLMVVAHQFLRFLFQDQQVQRMEWVQQFLLKAHSSVLVGRQEVWEVVQCHLVLNYHLDFDHLHWQT